MGVCAVVFVVRVRLVLRAVSLLHAFYGASLRDEEYERLRLGAMMKETAEQDARSFDDQGDEE